MLAWATSLSDGTLDPAEAARLQQHAAGLQVAEPRAAEVQRYAQTYLVDQSLEQAYAGGQPDAAGREAAYRLAAQLGLDQEATQRVEIRLRKRLGIV